MRFSPGRFSLGRLGCGRLGVGGFGYAGVQPFADLLGCVRPATAFLAGDEHSGRRDTDEPGHAKGFHQRICLGYVRGRYADYPRRSRQPDAYR